MPGLSINNQRYKWTNDGLRCCNCWLSVSGVFSHTYIRVYQNAQMRLAIAQDLQIPALTSRGQVHPSLSWRPPCPAPWSCPGCWTSCHSWWCHGCHWPGVTLSSSSSSLCCCYIIVTLHNDILVSYNTVAQGSAGCHRTHSELRLSRLLSPVAPDQLLTAGRWSAEPGPGREMGPSLRSWPVCVPVSRSYQETFR